MASLVTVKEVLVKRFQSKHSIMEDISCPYPSRPQILMVHRTRYDQNFSRGC